MFRLACCAPFLENLRSRRLGCQTAWYKDGITIFEEMIVDLFVFGNAYCAWTKRETVYVCEPRKYNKSCNCCKRVNQKAGQATTAPPLLTTTHAKQLWASAVMRNRTEQILSSFQNNELTLLSTVMCVVIMCSMAAGH
jgi:hypothetical protein